MTLHLNDAGTWRTITNVYVNDAGTWREIQEIWVNDAGTWRQVYVNDVISISNQNAFSSETGVTALAQYSLDSTGNVRMTETDNGLANVETWLNNPANRGNYDCRATMISGTLTSGTVGSWLNLASTRTWTLQRSTNGSINASFTLEIRRASDGTVLDTATISMQASFSP